MVFPPAFPQLFDTSQRHIHKLRVQITDACSFRCFYCMPPDAKFIKKNQHLSCQELLLICGQLVALGIDEVRVSGGEPLLRPEFDEIVEGLSQLPLTRLGVTTNGERLSEKIPFLKTTACRHINVSLDTLDSNKFKNITRSLSFVQVLQSILSAKEKGLFVKINVVMMRGVNDDEIFDFLEFSRKYEIEVRFLELMKIGCAQKYHQQCFMSVAELMQRIEERYRLLPVVVSADATAFCFKTDHGAKIGFVASESQPFCGSCSRLRLSADGYLRACLMSAKGFSLRGVPAEQFSQILGQVMALKPVERISEMAQPMYQIGG